MERVPGVREGPLIRRLAEEIAGYPGLFLICAVSGIAVPLPEDIPLLYAGVRLSGGEWGWIPTLTAATLGVGVRDVLAYGIGRILGDWVLTGWMVNVLGAGKMLKAQTMVANHGVKAILIGRFLIGFRAPVFIVCGATGIPLRKFVAWDALGLVVAVPAMVILGWAFGDPIVDSVFWVLNRTRLAGGVAFVAAAVWLWWTLRPTPKGT